MAIKEKTFRIGCGRYIQEKGSIATLGKEIKRLGTSPLIVGGRRALELTREKLEKSVALECDRYELYEHIGSCSDESANELTAIARDKKLDVIVGVGGGVICDLAKLTAHYADLPVINVPTSSATCAAYTPLSVRYTPDGKTVGTTHFQKEVDCVIVDTEVIATQPVRLLLSGIFDAMAKLVEIKQRIGEEAPMGLDYAYIMAEYSHKLLTEKMDKCALDMKNGELSEDLERVIFTAIAATGVISGIARGSNQTALAHKFYETARFLSPEKTRPYLHGELVGIGLLLQNFYNGEEENNRPLIEIMKKHGMPYRVTDVGLDSSEKTLCAFYDKICNSSAINKEDEKACERFKLGLEYLWNIK